MTQEPEILPSRRWRHADTGATASIYGAHPDPADPAWEVETSGWTIRWPDGRVGCGRPPFETREEAEAVVNGYELRRIQNIIEINREAGREPYTGLGSAEIGRHNRAIMFGNNDEAFPSEAEWSRVVD